MGSGSGCRNAGGGGCGAGAGDDCDDRVAETLPLTKFMGIDRRHCPGADGEVADGERRDVMVVEEDRLAH